MEPAQLALLQYGAVGAIAVLAIIALAYVTRRYITHLEAAGDQHTAALTGLGDALTANARELSALREDFDDRELKEERHRELLRDVHGTLERAR